MKTTMPAFKPEYLGFAAVVATLPIYEPALHSFRTIAPDTFSTRVLPYSAAALIGALLGALVYIVMGKHAVAPKPFVRRAPMIACALVGAAGLCLLAGPGLPPALAVATGLAGGLGSVLVLAAWGTLLSASNRQTVLAHLAGAGILGAFLMNTVGTLPYPLACALFGAFQLVAIAIPCLCRTPEEPCATAHATSPASPPIGTFVGIALFGLVFLLLGDHKVPYFYLSSLIGSIVAGAAVVPLVLPRLRPPSQKLLMGAILPLAGFGALAVAIAAPHSTAARAALVTFYSFAILVLLASLVAHAQSERNQRPAAQTFLEATAVFAGASLGGLILRASVPSDVCDLAFTVLTLVYLAGMAVYPTIGERQTSDTPHVTLAPEAITAVGVHYRLTDRETEILRLLAEGASSSAIASTLAISDSTARGHAHKIYQKLGVSTKEELLEFLASTQTDPRP